MVQKCGDLFMVKRGEGNVNGYGGGT